MSIVLPARQRAEQLLLVVADDAERRSVVDHVPDDSERIEDARPAVDEVTEEDGRPAVRVRVDRPGVEPGPGPAFDRLVAERGQERFELVGAGAP